MKTTLPLFKMIAVLLFGSVAMKAQTIVGSTTAACNNNGAISVTVTGLTPPISYSYSNMFVPTVVHSNVNSTIDNLTNVSGYQSNWGNANAWVVTASDGTNTVTGAFTVNPAFTFIDSVKAGVCPAMSTIVVNATGGTSPYTFTATNLNTNVNYSGPPVTVPAGYYDLVVEDAAGCLVTAVGGTMGGIYVYQATSMTANVSGSPANCTNGTATLNVIGGVSPFSYLWNTGATTPTLSGLMLGTYTCQITDAQGCVTFAWYYQTQAVTINYNGTVNKATCLQNNGAVTSFVNGGTSPYTFLWSNGATTQNLSNVPGGAYTVLITDANGCIGNGYINVGVSTPITVTYASAVSACTLATGAATVFPTGGASPYTVVWNLGTSVSTGTVISSQNPGTYPFKVTDANGCVQTGQAYIAPISTLFGNINNMSVACPQTTANLTMIASSNIGPLTYLWSGGATTTVLTNAGLGAHTCTVTDGAGCKIQKTGYVSQHTNLFVAFSSTASSCLFASDGTVSATAGGGVSPYTYNWSGGPSSQVFPNVATGLHGLVVTDVNGCHDYFQTYVGYNQANNSCYCVVTGTVYNDLNTSCTRNSGEPGVQNIQIHLTGWGYAYTNPNGVYSFTVPSGSYNVVESVQQLYPLASCETNNKPVSVTAGANCVHTVNFANNQVTIHDLKVVNVDVNMPVPGGQYQQRVIVYNDGTVPESTIQFGYEHDGQLNYSSCTPWAMTQPNSTSFPNWYRYTSGFPTLAAGSYTTNDITYNVPTNIPLATQINFDDTVATASPMGTSWLTDNTPWNNVDNHTTYVVSSFDPNFKSVSPQGTGPQGNIMHKDSVLTYVVHFQNTGMYFARNIVVIDTIDPSLNLSTLKPGYGDHKFTTSINESRVVKFTFENVNLPWQSTYGDEASSGMFTYSIRLKSNLPMGTKIRNKAAIYFDYNEPVITNTTLNTLVSAPPTGIANQTADRRLKIYPNPASNNFAMNLQSGGGDKAVIMMYDLSGRAVLYREVDLHAGQNVVTQSTDGLQAGIYIVKVVAGDEQLSEKLIIMK